MTGTSVEITTKKLRRKKSRRKRRSPSRTGTLEGMISMITTKRTQISPKTISTTGTSTKETKTTKRVIRELEMRSMETSTMTMEEVTQR